MGKQNTITEMEAKVKEGLRIAREAVDDQQLLKLCDDLEVTWDKLCANLIIVGVGLAAMKYRTREQIAAQLQEYLNSFQSSKKQHAGPVLHDTNIMN